jgi:hypothetical protein
MPNQLFKSLFQVIPHGFAGQPGIAAFHGPADERMVIHPVLITEYPVDAPVKLLCPLEDIR